VSIDTRVVETSLYSHTNIGRHLIVAMSNKRDKMELIVQKATECGISTITVVPMCRSVITSCNANKWKRLELIALEAVEQS
jgi:16S rRNA U1498 N3-methylase RsmE